MGTIPDDVEATAKRCVATAFEFLPFQARNFTAALEASYASTILAERERCVALAEAFAEGRDWEARFDRHEAPALRAQASFIRECATAIREGRTP